MRSYFVDKFGGFDGIVMREVEEPRPGPREVLIRIAASSLNFRDVAIVRGQYGGPLPKPGFVPLSDGAGEIAALGPLVRGFEVGDRVAGIFRQNWLGGRMPLRALVSDLGGSRDGVLAEAIVLHEESIVKLPRSLSFQEGATLPCAAVTAWHALHAGEPISAGETVLILGSGGVSVFALQFAHELGARVIATSSSDAKLERLRSLGADEVVNYNTHQDWDREVLRLTEGFGVDRVIEIGGAGNIDPLDAGECGQRARHRDRRPSGRRQDRSVGHSRAAAHNTGDLDRQPGNVRADEPRDCALAHAPTDRPGICLRCCARGLRISCGRKAHRQGGHRTPVNGNQLD